MKKDENGLRRKVSVDMHRKNLFLTDRHHSIQQTIVCIRNYAPRTGLPRVEDVLEVRTNGPVPLRQDVKPGECIVKNLYLSIDPAIRGWMTDIKGSYLPPLPLGSVMRGGSVGQVVFSRSTKIREGDYVNGVPDAVGWAQYGIAHERLLVPVHPRPGISPRAYVGVLGGTGLTAYFGLLEIGKPKRGETIVVNAAAGAGEFCSCEFHRSQTDMVQSGKCCCPTCQKYMRLSSGCYCWRRGEM